MGLNSPRLRGPTTILLVVQIWVGEIAFFLAILTLV